jgi:hypothetical protein
MQTILKLPFLDSTFVHNGCKPPTPATAAATTDAAFACPATTAATAGLLVTAASAAKAAKSVLNIANDATPTADQKRKVRMAAAAAAMLTFRVLGKNIKIGDSTWSGQSRFATPVEAKLTYGSELPLSRLQAHAVYKDSPRDEGGSEATALASRMA